MATYAPQIDPLPFRASHASALAALVFVLVSGPYAGAQDRLQTKVNELMRGVRGAVIVSNPTTGEILAEWNGEMAFHQALSPGSTAKLVASAVALEDNLISPSDRVFCRRVPDLLGEPYHCSHPTRMEPYTLASALANSCNYFFSALSCRLNAAELSHEYLMFGLGGIAQGSSVHGRGGAFRISEEPAAKARAVLGEYPILVTPAQLLLAYSIVATRGSAYGLWRPSQSKKPRGIERRIKLRARTWNTIEDGLEECTRSGTGQAAAIEGVRVAGKTGTSSAMDGSRATHAWFVGFAPVGSPRIAVVVVLKRGTGARDAAPLAGRIFLHYFLSKDSP